MITVLLNYHLRRTTIILFDKAINKYVDAKFIFHSDRRFQYTENTFENKIEKAGTYV